MPSASTLVSPEPEQIRSLIRVQTLCIVVALAIGVPAAYAAAQLLHALFYGAGDADPWTYFGVAVLLAATVLVAGYLPVRRATRTEHVVALHTDSTIPDLRSRLSSLRKIISEPASDTRGGVVQSRLLKPSAISHDDDRVMQPVEWLTVMLVPR